MFRKVFFAGFIAAIFLWPHETVGRLGRDGQRLAEKIDHEIGLRHMLRGIVDLQHARDILRALTPR